MSSSNLDAQKESSNYKLYYFNRKRRAEVSRLILAYATIPFEDIRYEPEEWPQHKSKMPFGQLPVLEWKGKFIPESSAIERFLARRHGLAGNDEWEEVQIDACVSFMKDIMDRALPVYRAHGDPAKKAEALDHYVKSALEPMLGHLEQRLVGNGTGYLVGSKISLADLVLFNLYDSLRALGAGATLTKSEQVTKLFNTVGDIPAIASWISQRPDTP